MDATPAALVDWFEAHGGIFDRSALTFAPLPGQGYGALARRDLAVRRHRHNPVPPSYTFPHGLSLKLPSLGLDAGRRHPFCNPARTHAVDAHRTPARSCRAGRMEAPRVGRRV
ncbi:hypothetical protein FA95DRAFT_1568124, partial [Auriscalpium vulgare]